MAIGALTDRSGNILVSANDWSWRLPVFVPVGRPLNLEPVSGPVQPTMEMDAMGYPVVAWIGTDDSHWNGYVRRWTGVAWEPIGSALSANAQFTELHSVALKIDNTNSPVLAWSEREIGDGFPPISGYVWRWVGVEWGAVGGVLSAKSGDFTSIGEPALQLDGAGNPVVAWAEQGGEASDVFVQRWNGHAWESVGGILGANPGSTSAYLVALQLDSAGRPVIAWTEYDGTAESIYVRRWTGQNWEALGEVLSAHPGNTPTHGISLQLDSSDRPFIAWSESNGAVTDVYVRWWNGQNWEDVGASLSANPGNTAAGTPSIQIDIDGLPVVAWRESDGAEYNIYVRRWTGTAWETLGEALNSIPGAWAYEPTLRLDANGQLAVGWQERETYFVYRLNR
jgi:hypothetical protein